MSGTIVHWNKDRLFGLIQSRHEDNRVAISFLHITNVIYQEPELLSIGCRVEFKTKPANTIGQHPIAVEVKVFDIPNSLRKLAGVDDAKAGAA